MKKGVIAVLLILVLVVIVSPGIVGKLAENSVDENLNWAVDQSAEFIVTSEGFDRGWFSSEGQHRVELGDGNLRAAMSAVDNAAPPVLIIDTRLDHGIIPVSSMSREEGSLMPGLGSAVSTLTLQHGDGESFSIPGAIYSKVDLSGNLKSSYLLEAGTLDTDDGTISWDPGKISISADPDSGAVKYDGDFGTLTITDSESTMSSDGMAFSGAQTKTEYGFFVGNMEATIRELSVIAGGVAAGGLKGGTIKAASAVQDGDVNATATIDMKTQEIPGFGAVSINMDMRLSGADAEALGLAQRRLEELGGIQDPTQMLLMAEQDLKGVFAAGFVFDIPQLDVALPMGLVETSMNIEIAESHPANFQWTSLLLSTDASIDVKVPEALVAMAQQMSPEADMLVGAGYLKKNGEYYELNADFKKGLLTINGAPLPIPFGAFQ